MLAAAVAAAGMSAAVTGAVCADHLTGDYLAVVDIIQCELRTVSEMLKDLSVFIGNCYSHGIVSFLFASADIIGIFA